MAPSKPLTERQRLKRRVKREHRAVLDWVTRHRLVRGPGGQVGYFVPVHYDPSVPPGQVHFKE